MARGIAKEEMREELSHGQKRGPRNSGLGMRSLKGREGKNNNKRQPSHLMFAWQFLDPISTHEILLADTATSPAHNEGVVPI